MENKDLTKNITNDPDGMYWQGCRYEHGIDVEKDEIKAFLHYQKSAEMKNSNGMYQVGCCYYLGIGVEIDKHKAFEYYLESAKAGNSMGIRKTAICYFYGIGVEESDDEYTYWKDEDPIYRVSATADRESEFGICAHCNEYNTNKAWCILCDPDIATTKWTSRNKDIDNCMKPFQLRALAYEDVIELIPFDRLSNVKEIGKGGFGSVYSAIWLDGIRKIDGNKHNYERAREPCSTVALKTLASSKEGNLDFLKEFKNLMACKLNYNEFAVYGITKNTKTNEDLMVFQYADNGSLYKYLKENFSKLIWQTKLQILKDISLGLNRIHNAKYIHADVHSGNILQDKNARSYIADLGLSIKENEHISKGNIYGVMPYVAPEVLSGKQQFTQASDIYGLGIIMAEISTGQRPFDGYEFSTKLAVKICNGLRPEFAPGTPKCYIKLAEKCMNSDPEQRLRAWDVYDRVDNWFNDIVRSNDNEIKKQFLDADKILQMPTSEHPDEMYTSKIINTNEIKDSIQLKLDITDN